ncbi:MAG: UvrD-helicase domain-containing protein [Collinsella sp.]|nr:UvrD-helicase domain-containing protein [Collinsella sp.]
MDLSTLMPQQRDIVQTLDRPLFVSAGAGSGKTFTLTRRILWALSPESGPFARSMDEIMAITFTRDAAAEIRERVRAALIEAGMAREALSVDDAWISTIHGMCARILRAHALELGLDPEFGVLTDAEELRDRAIDAVLSETADGFSDLLTWYRLSSEGSFGGTSVRSLVGRLLAIASSTEGGLSALTVHRGGVDLSGVADAYQALRENGAAAGVRLAEDALAAIDAYLESERTLADLMACLMACGAPRASKGFPKGSVAWLKAEVADAFVNAYLATAGSAVDELLELAGRVVEVYGELKRERSVLDNDDLLRLVYEALRDHEEIRAEYAGRFKLVMIDEFQDTDQQQVDLIGFLTGEGGRALCTVGDAQQSIYRFRGAEVEVFRRQQRAIEGAGAGGDAGSEDAPTGRIVKLVRNFRSHEQILSYVARIFDDAEGGIMPGFLNLDAHDGRADGLIATGASRRQALLVAGGATGERVREAARGIARRFRALYDADQDPGGMVVLLGRMTNAGVYADAIRDVGLDCVISGGSIFADLPEAHAIRALAATLANPADAAEGLAPLLQSPLFALGAEEFLALATTWDPETGETRRRNIDRGLIADEDAPGFGPLPLLDRAREVLRPALARVGRDPIAAIARDVVNESGLFWRLEAQGAEGRARAANVLKALDALTEAEAEVGRSPRLIARAFDRFLAGKQAPGALNEEGEGAVRIMTVHASKGLEFPVVAVAECYSIRSTAERVQTRSGAAGVELCALPQGFPSLDLPGGGRLEGDDIKARFSKLLGGRDSWLTLDMTEDVSATGSAAAAWLEMRAEEDRLSLEERARLLYVAMTRAREVCILAMDAAVSRGRGHEIAFDADHDLTERVLDRILPEQDDPLAADRLVFEGSQPGDFELVALSEFSHRGVSYEVTAAADGEGDPASNPAPAADGAADDRPDTFTLVWPAEVRATVAPAHPARDSYSYTSVAAAVHAEGEDRGAASSRAEAAGTVAPLAPAPGSEDAPALGATTEVIEVALEREPAASRPADPAEPTRDGDPTALGSAFHAAAQWLVETGAETVPAERVDALCRLWRTTPAQRERLERALARWERSRVRAAARAWPVLRAEVPFFTQGAEALARFGSFAEGAIDLLATDPADPSRALVIDYKTGGSPTEAPERLQEKHRLQAEVYADVLHRAGYAAVTLQFVCVEVPDRLDPAEPEVVTYEL